MLNFYSIFEMGAVNTKIAYTAGVSALAGIIIFVFFGPGGVRTKKLKGRKFCIKYFLVLIGKVEIVRLIRNVS